MDCQYAEEPVLVRTLENHVYFGPKGAQFYLNDGYGLSFKECKRTHIHSLTININSSLSALESYTRSLKKIQRAKDPDICI